MKNAPTENLKVTIRPTAEGMRRRGLTREVIFKSNISVGQYADFIDGIINLTEDRKSSYVCFANVHMLVEAHKDKSFGDVVNGADIVTPDGRPLSLFLRYVNNIKQERVCGMDVLPDLLRRAEQRKKSVFFYGSTDEVLRAVVRKARAKYPALYITGFYSPPFREMSADEKQYVIDMINGCRPDIVLVALGCPKQEKWMAEHKGRIFSCMLGVGQAFMVFAGLEKRLPPWMRDLSLEWLYRLWLEPKRLWKRYLFTNTVFVGLAMRHWVAKFFRRKPASPKLQTHA